MKAIDKVKGSAGIINQSGVGVNHYNEFKKFVAEGGKVMGKKAGVKLMGTEVKEAKKVVASASAAKPEAKKVAKAVADVRAQFLGKIFLHTKKDNRRVQVLGLKKSCPSVPPTGLLVKYLDDGHKGTATYKFLAPIAEKVKAVKVKSATK